MASHKSEPWWVLWVRVCLWFIRASKVLQLCINQLVDLCRFMWIIDLLITHPSSHFGALMRPFTRKMLQTKDCMPIPFSIVSPLDSHLNLKESLGVHHLLVTFIVPKFLNFCNHLIINSKKNTMLLLCCCKIFSIYFLLLALKIGPFFDYLGDNYFFYIFYRAFTLTYFLVIQLNYMHYLTI